MAITFNEAYYLQSNADVATAVSLGFFKSGLDHFNKIGARELRSPNAVFDAKFYATQNPDVLAAVSAGTFASVYDHYVKFGLAEGRAPNASLKGFDADTYLATYPDLAKGGVTKATALAHYVQFGVDEGRNFTSSTAGAVTGNYAGTTGDDIVTPAGGQASTVRVEGGQQSAAGDTLVITSGSASSFQVINLGTETGDQNQTRDNQTGPGTGNKVGPVVQGFENVDGRQATINLTLTALDRTSITNADGKASTQTGSVLQGGTGRDTLAGAGGNDVITGNDGSDVITGAGGNDSLSGGVGDDNIDGGAGADTISSGTGADTVTGGTGADVINVDGTGTKSIDGGADNDTITVTADQGSTTASSTISGNSGNDTINLNATAITAASRASVSGGAGNDTITAGLGVETVTAGAGNDTVKFTSANLGAADVFNGNDGQDFLQLEIPTGSGTNTYVLTPVNGQFAGFEGIELIDSSANTNAKQYKIVLTDDFVANNLVSGAFLIDARGLPGGSNLVIDFSQLTSASAARFAANAFRVLASPSTDIRDQNNNTITNTYLVNATNSALSATAAFNVFAGDTTVTAGSRNANGSINTNDQAAYTTTGGTAEVGTGVSGGGNTFTLTAANSILTTTASANATPANTYLTSGADVITGGANISGAFISDATAGDGDSATFAIAGANPTAAPTITNIETINLTTNMTAALSAGYSLLGVSGATAINITGGAASFNDAQNQPFVLTSGYAATLSADVTTAATQGVRVTLAGTAAGAGVATDSTGNNTGTNPAAIALTVTSNSTLSTLDAGAAGGVITVAGAGNLVVADATTTGTVNASALTGTLTFNDINNTVITGSGQADSFTQLTAAAASVDGGAGDDTFTFGTVGTLLAADTINGGAGTDTVTTTGYTGTTDLNGITNVEVLNLTGASLAYNYTTVDAMLAMGQTLTVNAANASGTSTLTFTGTAETNGAYNITGTANVDAIVGGANADTITGGNGADSITGGLGADSIILTEGTLASDEVVIAGGLSFDTITGFTVGATTGDSLDFSIGGLETAGAVVAGVTISIDTLVDGTTGVAAGDANTIQEIADQAGGAAVAATAGSDFYVLLDETYANLGALETGLETGDHELTVAAGAAVNDGFIVVWSDGTNAHVSMVYIAVDNADFAAGDLVATDLAVITGVGTITAGEFATANFDWIA